jgi:hypothetical protein
MKVNDRGKAMVKITREEILAEFFPEGIPKYLLQKPAPPPKSAAVKAEERWAAQKPIEAVIRAEAAHNQKLIERLKAEREAIQEAKRIEARRAQYQATIDCVWQNQLSFQASLAELRPSFHKGPGDPDW